MIFLGIDPGTASTGFGIVVENNNGLKAVSYGMIRTDKRDALPTRLQKIYRETDQLIRRHSPDEVVIEELFFNQNAKTALAVGQARGVLCLAAADNELKPFEYTPLQVKMAVAGYGRARKDQIQFMVMKLLRLDSIPKPDDVADALALAICHAHSRRLTGLAGRRGC
ncbi:MAG: crossover junction endodeoxyribonuclease RuvC [Terriglobia bacterium]